MTLLQYITPALEKLDPQSRPRDIKTILKFCTTRKAANSKRVIIDETSKPTISTKGVKTNVLASQKPAAPARKGKEAKTKPEILVLVVMKELQALRLQINKYQASSSKNKKHS
ncbi:hypothetical protein Tco_0481541 [Tanacetum coccineum]